MTKKDGTIVSTSAGTKERNFRLLDYGEILTIVLSTLTPQQHPHTAASLTTDDAAD